MKNNKKAILATFFIGLVLYFFSDGKYVLPLATWLAPVFILYFWRNEQSKAKKALYYIIFTVLTVIAWKGLIPAPGILFIPIAALLAFIYFIPVFLDRYFHRRNAGFLSTFIYPLTGVLLEYVLSFINPTASWGAIAYTQHNNIVLLQLISITGIYGIAFIVGWTASILNWVWENRTNWNQIKKGVYSYLSIMIIIFLFGSIRLNLIHDHSSTVQISSISIPLRHLTNEELHALDEVKSNKHTSQKDRDSVERVITKHNEELFDLTKKQAEYGSKIVFWSEVSGNVFKSGEKEFLKQASDLAKENHIYLMVAYASLLEVGNSLTENKVVAFDPNGKKVLDYLKNNIVPGDHNVSGTTPLQTFKTPYGKIGTAICFDTDFPGFIHTIAKQKPDILLIPKNDWKDIIHIHSYMGYMRGIENGFATIEQTGGGLSLSFDYKGNVLSKMYNDNAGEQAVMVSHVPTKGTTTFYGMFGDIFTWISVLFLLVLLSISRKHSIQVKNDPNESSIDARI
jgi:apolipoprotein N-acyltransferase